MREMYAPGFDKEEYQEQKRQLWFCLIDFDPFSSKMCAMSQTMLHKCDAMLGGVLFNLSILGANI